MRKLFLLSLVMITAACSSTAELKDGGQSFSVSGYSYDQVWDAAIRGAEGTSGDQALEVEKRLSISKRDKENGVIEASTGMSLLSWGELVGIYIEPPKDAPKHVITVNSLAKMKTNVFANNWEEELSNSIKSELDKTKEKTE